MTSTRSASAIGLPIAETELRALEQFYAIPPGHTGMVITGNRFAPHLRPGEIAVVDVGDRSPVSGELFVVTIETIHGKEPRVVQTFGRMECEYINGELVDRIGWYDRFRFKRGNEIILSDGPMDAEMWTARRCVGRIVGFVAPKWELT